MVSGLFCREEQRRKRCCVFCLGKPLSAGLELWKCSVDLGKMRVEECIFLHLLYGEAFAILHSVVFVFADRKGGAGKLRNA